MEDQYFEILAPERWLQPAVFNSPHSGNYIPPHFLDSSRLSQSELRKSEDCFVDELFAACQSLGAPLLRSLISRSYIDLNREPYELDPRMFTESLPGHINSSSSRVASGFGTIPKLVGEKQEIYRGKILLSDAMQRIDEVYRPYHRTLTTLVNECYNATGFALLVDCHSMPSSAVRMPHQPSVDIVLGDRFGSSCNTEISKHVANIFASKGLSVARNKPYAGGFITETHGSPSHNRHALQIEINRALYMDEERLLKNNNFAHLQTIIGQVISELLAFLPQDIDLQHNRLAAE